MKKVPLLYIIGAIAATFILHRVITQRKQGKSIAATPNTTSTEEEEVLEVEAQMPNPTTPVSGTSQTILDGFNENDAQLLKEELKN